MKDIQQLIKKNSQEGRYEDIFPKTFIDAVLDKESGVTLTDILAMFNMLFLSYNGSRSQTRLQVPSSLRREGLWVTYVLYDKTVVTEWYSAEAIDDTTFGDSANWRDGSNALVGDISISLDRYWVINGEVTNIKAQGEAGITPILRVGSNNHLQVSYTNGNTYVDVSPNPVFTQFRVSNNKLEQSVDLGLTWTVASNYIAAWFRFTGTTGSSQADNVGKIQISRDNGATWSDLSGEFTNSLHIKGYVATVDALPSTAVQGDIYGVGPTYDPSDTGHTNPIYQLYVKNSTGWVNNGKFTSIAAGVVQTTGTSTTEVMSQDAVSNEFASVRSDLNEIEQEQIQGGVYDVSSHNNGAVFESLSALLGSANLSTLIPTSVRRGGMSIRFIQGSVPNSNNKYMQARCMAQSFTTGVTQWQSVDDEPTAGSNNLVKSGGVQTAIANVDTKTDFTRRLVFTEGYAHIHPVSTDVEGKYIFDGNWTVEVKHQLVAEGFIKTTGTSYIGYNRITIPNGNYNFTYLAEQGQYFSNYKLWCNIKTKTFYYGQGPTNDDPNWFEAFDDIHHSYYYWQPTPEGTISLLVTRKSSPSSNYSSEFINVKKAYIGGSVYMDKILPDNVSDYPINLRSLVSLVLANKNIDTKLVFSEKLYRISDFPMTNVNIVGAGIDKTIFSLYDTTNEETSGYWATTFHTIAIKDCTIKNRGFEQYSTSEAINKSATFENVKFWVTLGSSDSYLIFTASNGFKLHIKNCILLNESEGSRMCAGIWAERAEYVEVINTRIGDYFTRPCANYYVHQAFIDNVDVTKGMNGIFFAANRENPLENTIVQNCTVRFVDEECISFDALGNNVAGNPMVCELSIADGEIIQDASGGDINKRLKLYCNARYLVGTHPNEHYEAYSIVEHSDLIKKMYVAFDEPSGNVFAGTVVKVLDCGKEIDGEEREWILIDTQLPFEDLNLLENTDIDVVNNNYKVAMVTSGFFNVRVTHNKCYGGKRTGIALYNAIYHCTVDNNHVSNCRTGSYLGASKMLATGVYNGACGNIITNNVFEGGEGYGFDFEKFDKVFGYHNVFANNLILNNKGVRITYEKGLTYEGNSIIGPNAILDLSRHTFGANVVETNTFGTVFPTAPTPGHRFFKTDESKEYMWNGTEWVE